MIHLSRFAFPTREQEDCFFDSSQPGFKKKNFRTVYTSKYPFNLFRDRELPVFEFSDITIFCGNNGSGKSTILNVIAEKIGLERGTVYNRSDFFEDYTELCRFVYADESRKEPPADSRIITSDDVFENVLSIRRLNEGIDERRNQLIHEYITGRDPNRTNTLAGLDDYERWRKSADLRKKSLTQSAFIRKNLIGNVQERSNGESALAYFVEKMQDSALYLLDEPENSLSPQNQLQLKYFIEDAVRNHSCQFIVSTHSPFILSLRRAKIYDLDTVPPMITPWTELESVRTYYDFFQEYGIDFAE